jgi:F-type H+-transporting ATPase subunit b
MHLLLAAESTTRVVLPKIDELIFGTIAFAILFALLWRVAFPALRKGLEQREQAIRSELERAEQARLEAEQRREEYDARLAQAREEADRVLAQATEAAESLRRERVERAEEEARQIVEKARTDAAGERERAFGELRTRLADIAIDAASRVLQKELSDPASQRQLVEQFIAQTSSAGNGQGN